MSLAPTGSVLPTTIVSLSVARIDPDGDAGGVPDWRTRVARDVQPYSVAVPVPPIEDAAAADDGGVVPATVQLVSVRLPTCRSTGRRPDTGRGIVRDGAADHRERAVVVPEKYPPA